MPQISLSVLDEFYIKYTKVNSSVFRLDGIPRKTFKYKIRSFDELRKYSESGYRLYIYSLIHEQYRDKTNTVQSEYFLDCYIPADNLSTLLFVSPNDENYINIAYIANIGPSDDDLVLERAIIGDNSYDQMLVKLAELYKNDPAFKIVKDASNTPWSPIFNYATTDDIK